jgi:hypothetical protein
MNNSNASPLVPVDDRFLKRLKVGDRLFYFSTPDDYTLYSVVDLPTEQDVVLLGAFDEAEKKTKLTHAELLSGGWKYNQKSGPLFARE